MPDMHPLEDKVAAYIHRKGLLSPGDRVMAAVSYGADSMALQFILRRLGYDVKIAHCHFGLRPEADQEQNDMKAYCNANQIPFFTQRFDTRKVAEENKWSIQEAARRLRYDWFDQLRKELKDTHFIATGHHQGDQAETVLFNLLRSHSYELLAGIPPEYNGIVRPLLECTPEEIRSYVQEHGIPFSEDSSNADDSYVRNFIRLRIGPLLAEVNPSWREKLAHTTERYGEQLLSMIAGYRTVSEKCMKEEPEGIRIRVEELVRDYYGRGYEEYLAYILESNGFTGLQAREAIKLVQARSGAIFTCENGQVRREGGDLLIQPANDRNSKLSEVDPSEECSVSGPGAFRFGNARVLFERISAAQAGPRERSSHIQYLDADKVHWPVLMRRWRTGDKMQPAGMKGHKKLSDIFVDEKIPVRLKNEAIVFQVQEQIISLSGFRVSESVKVDDQTEWVLKITISQD